jgi:hypothetical protein
MFELKKTPMMLQKRTSMTMIIRSYTVKEARSLVQEGAMSPSSKWRIVIWCSEENGGLWNSLLSG